ncbi:hypothetical protein ElyMa_004419700 [Elysia marginata]|uniref:Uncharacterized protein n=1 Tax=Elysia marginata TaxID=1093978 RepID=A0AAV4HAX9_9GAST|nr:hypothetical protein ElyMa_004419700 [Elysia marginata]
MEHLKTIKQPSSLNKSSNVHEVVEVAEVAVFSRTPTGHHQAQKSSSVYVIFMAADGELSFQHTHTHKTSHQRLVWLAQNNYTGNDVRLPVPLKFAQISAGKANGVLIKGDAGMHIKLKHDLFFLEQDRGDTDRLVNTQSDRLADRMTHR